MSPKTRSHHIVKLAIASLTFFATSLIIIWVNGGRRFPSLTWVKPLRREYTYRGNDYPQTWPIPELELVHMAHEDSVHYSIDTPIGIGEWNATLPSGGVLLRLGTTFEPFTLSMFHQLRCLNIVREVIVDLYADDTPDAKTTKPELARHCMNYIRQMVLCRADMRLESVRAPKGHQMTVSDVTHTCRDWTTVYDAAERNYREFMVHVNNTR
ncbi:unnamed protein product [Somion occarium]|uniref:Uncharacterized protein n=1 Tax=Somion occarium TaxID=3059160 RepID=A0ABP1CS12_9APHY